jgi:hypothetical protein
MTTVTGPSRNPQVAVNNPPAGPSAQRTEHGEHNTPPAGRAPRSTPAQVNGAAGRDRVVADALATAGEAVRSFDASNAASTLANIGRAVVSFGMFPLMPLAAIEGAAGAVGALLGDGSGAAHGGAAHGSGAGALGGRIPRG